jgi:hypothetical protein
MEMYDLPCDVDTELLKLRQIRTAFDLTFLLVENTACRGCRMMQTMLGQRDITRLSARSILILHANLTVYDNADF